MKPGDVVKLRAYGGHEIERRVVDITETVVAVCRNEEYEQAMREGRQPLCVGFPKDDVLTISE